MSDERTPKTPGDYTLEQIEAFRPLAKILGFFNKDVREHFREVESQLDSVKQMIANRDLFAKTYSLLGWVNYDRLSTEIVASVVRMTIEDGEVALTNHHLDPDTLRFFGYRFSTSHYEPWRALYERAVERSAAGDYLSAVPLTLIMIDGICTTTTGKHPFSGGADAPVFDSQTSGPGGLPESLALLGSTRRKLDTEVIPAPFRHGIVHGLNPNFGSPMVTAKAFNLLQATVDYFDRRRDEVERVAKAAEEQKPVDIRELGASLRRNAEYRRAIEEWCARPAATDVLLASSDAPAGLPVGSPEAFAAEYLGLLIARNFGSLARVTVDYPKRTIGYRAGRLRDDLKEIAVTRWAISGVEDTSSAMSRVTTKLEGRLNGQTWSGEHAMRLVYADENCDAMARGQPNGAWTVMPDFLTGLWLLAIKSGRNA